MTGQKVRTLVSILVLIPVMACGGSSAGVPPGAVPPTPGDQPGASERNDRLLALAQSGAATPASSRNADYRVGSGDLLDIRVFDAPDLSGEFRISGDGTVSLPLVGPMAVDGLTTGELQRALTDTLAATYMKDPTVTVQVAEMGSHGVSVVGAVRSPGVFQLRAPVTLLEVLAMAEGLSEDAGETVLVVPRGTPGASSQAPGRTQAPGTSVTSQTPLDSARGPASGIEAVSDDSGAPAGAVEVSLSRLLDDADATENVMVQPGDIVRVQHTGIVYVVGEVNNPGGFPIGSRQRLTIPQALALAGGMTRTAADGSARIIRTDSEGRRSEIPVDLDEAMDGEDSDIVLHSKDVIFIPNSTAKSLARGAVDALVRMVTLRGLFGG